MFATPMMFVPVRFFAGCLGTAIVMAAAGMGQADDKDRVLRHAVFFKFKESSSDADVAKVVKAFEALPSKIDSIVDFEWGTRTSGDRISGGYTHAFILTFKDEAGRAKYLPHPAHKAFGATLRPHLAGVFVIDYWAKPEKRSAEKVLRHMVFFKFKPDADQAAVKHALETFAALPQKIDSIESLEWGKNNSPESHDAGYTHAFMVTFKSEAGLKKYGPHEAHQALVKLLRPVMEEVRVIDFWTQ